MKAMKKTLVCLVMLAVVCAVTEIAHAQEAKPSSYAPVVEREDFDKTVSRMSAAKAEVMQRQMDLLEMRYDLSNQSPQLSLPHPARALLQFDGCYRVLRERIESVSKFPQFQAITGLPLAKSWVSAIFVRRWLCISQLTKSRDGQPREISPVRIALEKAIADRVKTLRSRLSDPSSFMAALCEHVVRRSNREDQCRGSFWEDRFDCRQLVDQGAVLICGIYVDLNQILRRRGFHTGDIDAHFCLRTHPCACAANVQAVSRCGASERFPRFA